MYGKILIRGELELLTGMHIGGSAAFSAIGAVDKPVVRDPATNDPILPGSSLKGKLRTLLARSIAQDITQMPDYKDDGPVLCRLFGASSPQIVHSRLQFSDCFVRNKEQFRAIGLTEVKAENAISRTTAVANPRQIERVISGVVFGVNIVYDVMEESEISEDFSYLTRGMKLLQFDYLGGHGTRGYGRVHFRNLSLTPLECTLSQELLHSLSEMLKKEVEDCELFRL